MPIQLVPKKQNNRENEKKTEIPKKFIRKIKKLGLRQEDAVVLYETMIDWETVYADNKIYCAETGCDFVTEIDNPALQEHTKKIHDYKDQPCEAKDCNYIGFSKKNLNIHNKMHTKYSGFVIFLDIFRIYAHHYRIEVLEIFIRCVETLVIVSICL